MTTTIDTPASAPVTSHQRGRALALANILALRGLPEAVWTIWPGDDMHDNPGLNGHLTATDAADANEQLRHYATALGLKRIRGEACGWYRGVRVQIVATITGRAAR